MAPASNITSVRIVNVDHYMHHPVAELDACYAEYRGSMVSKVPVIRMFGTDIDGTKSCVHIHGVFPYLYIPFDEHLAGSDSDRYTYQVAASLDKAINISLGQASSTDEHVFKIVHVKAIPFYGFHSKEHQFLKIYLYNPHFVRRAASLFQSGAILGKVFQPHESHVPYILQFMIDYNLYGMSFLHVPCGVIRFRKHPNDIISDDDIRSYITSVERTSVSRQEFDISAAYILNRLDINAAATQTDHANPGIASIWKDEQVRRSRESDANYPELEIPAAEHRPDAQPTESHQFYRDALTQKLSQIIAEFDSQNADETIHNLTLLNATTTDTNVQKPKFNLKMILNNSVYPSECSQQGSDTLLNASYIVDHQRKRQQQQQQLAGSEVHRNNTSILQNSVCLDDTLVDEDIVNSLSQKRTTNRWADVSLSEAEFELLDIMEQLEANESASNIENDSILATLSQPPPAETLVSSGSISSVRKSIGVHQVSESDDVDEFHNSDDDLFNDFSMCLDEHFDEQSENIRDATSESPSKSLRIPQLDGGDDLIRKSSRSRYPELNVTLCQSPKRAGLDKIIDMLKDKNEVSLEPIAKRRRISPFSAPLTTNTVHTNGVIDLTLSDEEDNHGSKTNDTSFVACRLQTNGNTTPKIQEKRLKVVPVSKTLVNNPLSSVSPTTSTTTTPTIDKHTTDDSPTCPTSDSAIKPTTNNVPDILLNKQFADIILNAPRVKLQKLGPIDKEILSVVPTQPVKPIEKPHAEPEKTGRYAFRSRVPRKKTPLANDQVFDALKSNRVTAKKKHEPTLDELHDNIKCDVARQYDIAHNFFPEPGPSHVNFYENMDLSAYFAYKSTSNTDNLSSPIITNGKPLQTNEDTNKSSDPCINIRTLLRAPTFDEVLESMPDYNIPYCQPQEPFYSNSEDATSRKEVSHSTVLDIPTKSHKDIEEFVSDVVPRKGITAKKKQMITKAIGNNPTANQIQSFLGKEDVVAITTVIRAPTMQKAQQWLSRNVIDKDQENNAIAVATMNGDALGIEFDSPAKVRRETAKGVADDTSDVDAMDTNITLLSSSPESAISSSQPVEEDCIELSPNAHLPKRPLRLVRAAVHKDVQRLRRRLDVDSPNMFAGSGSSASCNGSPTAANEVICLDDDDEDTAMRGHVSVNKSHTRYGSSESLADYSFGISGASLENTFGFKMDLDNFQTANAHLEYNYLTILSLEIHVRTRGALKPNPQHDEIICLFYNVQNNNPVSATDSQQQQPQIPNNIIGVIINEVASQQTGRVAKAIDEHIDVQTVASEHELLLALVRLIDKWDPDIFAGYEIEMASWGYVLQRGQTLNMNLPSMMSRIPKQIFRETPAADEEAGGTFDYWAYPQFEVKLCGRIFLDVWRLMRSEIALTSYTFESVMYHIMHRRCPLHGFRELTRWWGAETAIKGSISSSRWIVLQYYMERVKGNLELLNHLDLIGRTCEMAKLFGIQFFEVLSRGSQFRVESMMLRIAKPKNIIPVSPSVQQRAHMRAPEYLPLILEPLSRLYTDSVIVLDFQSLYPSMMIAYNYCFSTCLGRVEHLGQSQPFEFGASQLRISPKLLRRLIARDLVEFSPCGAVFVKSKVREGVLPRMLKEILDTRLMVKQSMKLHRGDPLLQRVLHSRQLGLKLMANVTYGYTAANFSGRMPCVEVGDSVVSKGRETLERAIKMVAANKKWRSRVIYGDTDSLFVLVPGQTREVAFQIGAEIAEAVTQDNPHPVKLKLEKIYQPCILQTKKRYVGYLYETADQATPIYEAKGIETVRRDGCPAVAKMLEKTLKILFETRDVSKVKLYICRQFTKILSGKANIQDFIFAKEFRGIQGYKPGACVPSLELTRKWLMHDPRSEPRRGERVPYVVVNGPPGVPLIRLVRDPHEFLDDPGLKINSLYYITKCIVPPLNRCLLLIGADAAQWYNELPRKHIVVPTTLATTHLLRSASLLTGSNKLSKMNPTKKSTISQYFSTASCPTDCGAQTQSGAMCPKCVKNPQRSCVMLTDKMFRLDRKRAQVLKLCASCCGRSTDVLCRSLDCPVLYVLNDCNRHYEGFAYLRQVLLDNFA